VYQRVLTASEIRQLYHPSARLTTSYSLAVNTYADIVVADDAVLTSVSDGSAYYTKPEVMIERYPKAASSTTCAGLALTEMPSKPTNDEAVANPPLDTGDFPSDAVTSKYLNSGNPVAVAGQTLYELASASA
jgi:hypothetical protein